MHPRTKGLVGGRLAQAAYATLYGGDGPALGPVLSSCVVRPATQTLVINFNASLLGNASVAWASGASLAAENTALYVLAGARLPDNVADNHHAGSGSYQGERAPRCAFALSGERARARTPLPNPFLCAASYPTLPPPPSLLCAAPSPPSAILFPRPPTPRAPSAIPSAGPYANGNEWGVSGWTAVNAKAGPGRYQIVRRARLRVHIGVFLALARFAPSR